MGPGEVIGEAGILEGQAVIADFIPAGDSVVAVGKTSGTVKATGKSFACNLAHVWTVKDGKIVRFEVYIDTPAMAVALS